MALPNSITFDNDTLANHAWESVSHNCVNLLTKGGETLLPMLAAQGRIFGVPDTEHRRDDFFYAEPGDTTYAGVRPGTFGTGVALGQTSAEFLSSMYFTFQEWQNNIPWPTTFPQGGDAMSAVMGHVKAKAAKIFEQEEAAFVRGATSISGTYAAYAPFSGDTDFDNTTDKMPMSLLGLYCSGTATSSGVDDSAQTFANIKEDDTAEWAPTKTGGTPNGSNLHNDLRLAEANATFGSERPTMWLTALAVWDKLATNLVGMAALNQPAQTDVGHGVRQAIYVSGTPVYWSRFLADNSVLWDFAAGATAHYPILGLNMNSLRLDVPVGGGAFGAPGLNYVRKISNTQVRESFTGSFYRIAAKRQMTLDGGRRSFAALSGITL